MDKLAEVAEKLDVPASDRPAFAELYGMLVMANRLRSVSRWREMLQEKPAQAQIRAFMQTKEEEINTIIESFSISREAFEQRMIFTGVYGSQRTMDEALEKVK